MYLCTKNIIQKLRLPPLFLSSSFRVTKLKRVAPKDTKRKKKEDNLPIKKKESTLGKAFATTAYSPCVVINVNSH